MAKSKSTKMLFLAIAVICAAAALTLYSRHSDKSEWMSGKPLPKDNIVIGIIHVDDASSGYSYAHDNAIRFMQQQFALSDEQIIRKFNVNDSDTLMLDYAMRDCINQGANVIIATSWGHRDMCEKLAELYPNVLFTNATGDKHNAANFTNYFGRMYQARYLSGIVAGLKTRTNNLGFVAAMDKTNSEVTSGVNAFARGVESVNPEARVHVRVTNSWYDPNGERHATQRLLDGGCDVIAQHCNTPDPQQVAEKSGFWGIGFNSDMMPFAPKAVLASVVWKWEVYYLSLVQSIIDGTFTTTPYLGDLKDGMIDLTPLNPALTDSSMEQAVAQAKKRLQDGVFDVFDGVLMTNDGRTIGKRGEPLSDAAILQGMHWYYHTVVE